MKVTFPADFDDARIAALRAAEADAARALAAEDTLLRLWRSADDGFTWGLWRSTDGRDLAWQLARLPLRPYMSVNARELVSHPNDPVADLGPMDQPVAARPRVEAATPGSMPAIVKTGPGPESVVLQQCAVPRPARGQVLVEVHGAGICGTDLHIAVDEYPTRPPVIMGHEVAGIVVGVGPGVDDSWVGARVALETHHQVCDCDLCRGGRRNLCPNKASMGSFVDGGFASYVVVADYLLHRVPDHVSDYAAALTEPLACVCHSLLDPAVINAGDRVLVTGPGPVGLLAAQVARASGGIVTVVGLPNDSLRLEVAATLGFSTQSSADPESFDVAIECSGSQGGATTALQAVRRGGRYVCVGIFGGPVTLPFDLVLYKELTVTSGFAATAKSWRRALHLLEDRLIDLEALITDVLPLSAWDTVLADLRRSVGLKIVFDPRLPLDG